MALLKSRRLDTEAFFRRQEKVLVVTHSYGHYLKDAGLNSFEQNDRYYNVEMMAIPSATYQTYLDRMSHWERMRDIDPTIVFVILGGNVVGSGLTRQQMTAQCRKFYQWLRFYLPNATIVSVQVELRWYVPVNRYHAPEYIQYTRDRNFFNNFLARQITDKDYMLCIGGSGRLDNEEFYIEGDQGLIHMNPDGMRQYIIQIKKQCNYIYMQICDRYERKDIEAGLARLNRKCVRGRRDQDRRDRRDRRGGYHPYAR